MCLPRIPRIELNKLSKRTGEWEMARMDMSTQGVKLGTQAATPEALFELGMLYATGREVEADLVVAHKWFNLAAMGGNGSALALRMGSPARCPRCRSQRPRGSRASGSRRSGMLPSGLPHIRTLG